MVNRNPIVWVMHEIGDTIQKIGDRHQFQENLEPATNFHVPRISVTEFHLRRRAEPWKGEGILPLLRLPDLIVRQRSAVKPFFMGALSDVSQNDLLRSFLGSPLSSHGFRPV